jgi:hypothetical protein
MVDHATFNIRIGMGNEGGPPNQFLGPRRIAQGNFRASGVATVTGRNVAATPVAELPDI